MLPPNATVCLRGELGAGKTTLIKGIAQELSGTPPYEVNSPTFTYLNIYEGKITLYHFDCYRLKDEKDFLSKGLDEYFDIPKQIQELEFCQNQCLSLFGYKVCLIEWPERIEKLLPKERVHIHIEYLGENKRKICYEKNPL